MNIPPAISNIEIKHNKLFINNDFVDSRDGSSISIENPSTGKEICRVSEAKKADVDLAVESARNAFLPGSQWRNSTPSKRAALLNKLADLMERDRHQLATLESLDGGKLYLVCWYNDVPFSANVLRYFAGWCDKDPGQTLPSDKDHFMYTRHEPIGVCGAIIPWNVPLMMFCWKLAPCIATGNVLVIKPSEFTPLTALYMASLIKEAGFPPGVVNVVPGYGNTAGESLSHHMNVNKIAFTGSTATGRLIQKASADSNLKKVSLELGGKSPIIILPDVDVDKAVEIAHTAVFTNNGQMCCAGTRTFVHEDIYDEFVRKSVKQAKAGVVGDPSNLKTKYGPLINRTQKEKVLKLIRSGKNQGCSVLCGGDEVKDMTGGHFIQPTVLTHLFDDMEVSNEEVFGPVQQIYKFKNLREAVKRANNTKYGLAAAVLTNDFSSAIKLSNSLEAGIIWINDYFHITPNTPFGGYKLSGTGRDLSEYALREYTQVKVVIAKL